LLLAPFYSILATGGAAYTRTTQGILAALPYFSRSNGVDIAAFNALLTNRGYHSSCDSRHPTERDVHEIDVLRGDQVIVTFATRTLRDMGRDEVLRAIEEAERKLYSTTGVARLRAIAARFANALYQDGTKILAQVQIGPIRDLASMPFPCANVEFGGYGNLRVTVYFTAETVDLLEHLAAKVADGLYDALHLRGSFHHLLCSGAVYRTITYWFGASNKYSLVCNHDY
jgi:hypothetical protein